MERGRPVASQIRQNIIEILFFMNKGYGYDIYKTYRSLFPKVTLRSIYYHLKKGEQLGEFKVHKIQKEEGDYSWGNSVEKIYYTLGPNANPQAIKKVGDFISKN
ncbi:hypothetical protein KY311_00215 [Candidatus Woesearchaeota archaeon]|nr:hypothetical protein [Candidatus Woesearchaeota archaeon]MBW3017184.1 hypothetical protein [Candidatus Woesearchaeota archaeon]